MSIMTSRQASELDFAFERNGWTSEDVKKVSGGDVLTNLLLVVRGRARVVVDSILTFLRTVKLAAQPAMITSKEYFEEAGVKVTGTNFETQFYGLEVAETPEAELAVSKLEQDSLDASILAKLGDKAETLVSQFKAFLSANRESKEWFIFYLRGKDGNLSAVDARWFADGGGWDVDAHSVAFPSRWSAGRQVLSQA